MEEEVVTSYVSTPARVKKGKNIYGELLLPYFPGLKEKLEMADISESAQDFALKLGKMILISTLLFSIITIAIFFNSLSWLSLLSIPIYLLLAFLYFRYYPNVLVLKKKREIESELIFAARHIIISLRSGMTLFDSIVGVSYDYGETSKVFKKVVDKVLLGVPMTQALKEVAEKCPSRAMNRVLLQINNSLVSGANIADSLEVIVEQIAKEQVLELKAYGQKLNPLILFYLIFGIVFPPLFIAFLVTLVSVISGSKIALGGAFLWIFMVIIGIIHFLFFAAVEGSRPKYYV